MNAPVAYWTLLTSLLTTEPQVQQHAQISLHAVWGALSLCASRKYVYSKYLSVRNKLGMRSNCEMNTNSDTIIIGNRISLCIICCIVTECCQTGTKELES